MKSDKMVVIVCADHPLTTHDAIVKRLQEAYKRALRQGPRFKDIDLVGVQKEVGENIIDSQFLLDGQRMGLLDLMNFVRNEREGIILTPENTRQNCSLANRTSLNGYYLFDFLRRHGFDPQLIQNFSLDRKRLEALLDENPLAVCISTTLIHLDSAKEIASFIREICPDIPVVAGGAGVKKTLHRTDGIHGQTKGWIEAFGKCVDAFIIEAQGEWTLLKVLHTLMGERDLHDVANLAIFPDGEGLTFTRRETEPIDMDGGVVHWGHIPEMYLRKTLPIQTSKGCRYRCRFCTYWRLLPGVHHKSIASLKKELRALMDLGELAHLEIIDDNFTSDPERMDQILKMMIEEAFPFSWSSHARCDAITRERAYLMKESGCEFVEMGLESGSQAMLDRMGKGIKVEQMRRAIAILNEMGIDSVGFFILGFPGETEETIQKTIDFIEASGLPYYQFMLFSYSRSMLIAKEREKYGLHGLAKAWRHHSMDAITASRYFKKIFAEIKGSLTDGQTSTREAFKLLRGEGYSPSQIKELFGLSNALNRIRIIEGDRSVNDPSYKKILDEMEKTISLNP